MKRKRIPIIKRLVILGDTNERIIVSNVGSSVGDLTLFPNSNNGETKWDECISTMIIKAKYDYGSNNAYNFKVIERSSKIKGISGKIIN